MTTRTFKQYGIAFGEQPIEIVAKIDNTVVYQGPVTTLNQPVPYLPDLDFQVDNELFSWTSDVSVTGEKIIEIQVTGQALLVVAELKANWSRMSNVNVSSGPNNFVGFNSSQFGNAYINGIGMQPNTTDYDSLGGQWWWPIPPNGNLIQHVNIPVGYVGNITAA